jgi:hypothetical protein
MGTVSPLPFLTGPVYRAGAARQAIAETRDNRDREILTKNGTDFASRLFNATSEDLSKDVKPHLLISKAH